MRITRIELNNWKNFTAASAELADRVFIVGPNASGKSNFLDAFRFLHDLAVPGGGLQRACMDRGGVAAIKSLSTRANSPIGISVKLGKGGNTIWQYEVSFAQQSGSSRLPIIRHEAVYQNGQQLFNRPDLDDSQDSERLTQTALEQSNLNKEFREIARFLQKIYYLHLVPQVIRTSNQWSGNGALDAYGRNFLERVARTPSEKREERLRRIRDALVVAVPQLQELRLERDNQGVPHLVSTFSQWSSTNARLSEDQFSDGTLRMIGLLWALQEGDGPLLLEEPELSLHTGIVRRLPGLVYRFQKESRRQVLMSTHSSDMLSDRGIGGEEVLMLVPTPKGTEIKSAASVEEIRLLLEAGLTPADAILPHTEPKTSNLLNLVTK